METEQTRCLLEEISFPEVSGEVSRSRELLRRVDTKFVLSLPMLRPLLETLDGDFGILRAGGETVASYRTLYFDTVDYHYLLQHHRERRPRFKVRIRHYLERQKSMLEVKKKTNTNMTVKKRRGMTFSSEALGEAECRFIDGHNPVSSAGLLPSFRTSFSRISLVGFHSEERITFDLDLRFQKANAEAGAPGAVIAEVKQARFMPRSPGFLAFRELGLRPCSVSKYCTAAMLLAPQVRLNRLQPSLRSLRAVCHA